MQISTHAEVQEVAAEFGRFARDIASEEPLVVGDFVASDVVDAVAEKLSASGWRDVSEVRDGEGGLHLLAAVAESSTAGRFPLPYPLVEDWWSNRVRHVHLRDVIPQDLAATWSRQFAAISVDLVEPQVLLMDHSPTSVTAPARASEILLLTPVVDGYELHVVSSFDDDTVERPVDLTLPVRRLSAPGPDQISVRLPISDGTCNRIIAELLCLHSAEMLGAATWLFQSTLKYLKERHQFDRPLSSFQALQHRMAHLHVQIETARSLHIATVDRVETGGPDALEHAIAEKGYVGHVATRMASESVQLHGGMGYTWEAALHWTMRRIYHRAAAPFSAKNCLAAAGRRAVIRGAPIESIPMARWMAPKMTTGTGVAL